MRISEWNRIKVIEDWMGYDKPMYIGELFITGNSVIGQKEMKEVGDKVTYYRVVKSEGKNIQYIFVNDILEEG